MKSLKEERKDGYPMGPTTVALDDEGLVLHIPHLGDRVTAGGTYRAGETVEENAQQDAARDAEMAQQEFANTIKLLIGNMVSDKPVTGKIVGHNAAVKQVLTLAKLEKDYISNILTGKSPDQPDMIKRKSTIEKEAENLKLLTGLKWPFN